jgi:hypothetical protein
MTTVRSIVPRDPTQADLIRYFDRNLLTADTVGTFDRFAIETWARHERAALMGEFIGAGVAWLWQRVTHFGETRSPAPRFHVESRVQF